MDRLTAVDKEILDILMYVQDNLRLTFSNNEYMDVMGHIRDGILLLEDKKFDTHIFQRGRKLA